MNRKKMPIMLMLVAGAVAWIITFVKHDTILQSMLAVFISLVVFFILGSIMRWILDYFEEQNEKLKQEQLEVAEAEQAEQENAEGEQVAAGA